MNTTSPAIVAQNAVRRLPRWVLLTLCTLYVLTGFFGRSPWKNTDITAFGYIMELANGRTSWLNPMLGDIPASVDGLLPFWLGAWSVMVFSPLIPVEIAARIPFIVMLGLTLLSTWYAVYYLARTPQAQPVAFAFGGEARPTDYARALADGGLLALLACLGLAQLSHEITSDLAQLCCVALVFYAVAASPYRLRSPAIAFGIGLLILALSGAPSFALLMGLGCIQIILRHPAENALELRRQRLSALVMTVTVLIAGTLVLYLDLIRWRISLPERWIEWRNLVRLLIWFAWPAWPLAAWALWRWRHKMRGKRWPVHLALPVWLLLISLMLATLTQPADRALLLGFPALAALAAMALPTLSRSLAALIDWFTLLFFSAVTLTIWIIWLALQTGFPAQPAANVARLLPEFQISFSWPALLIALTATTGWCWLVGWRIGRNRQAIWKSLVLPAGGTVLAWVLLMTLWLPILDYARSYTTMTTAVRRVLGSHVSCVEFLNLSQAQIAALQYHAQLRLYRSDSLGTQGTSQPRCDWLVTDWQSFNDKEHPPPRAMVWEQVARIYRLPGRSEESVLVYRRYPSSDHTDTYYNASVP